MKRDFLNWNIYLNTLLNDVYPAPPDVKQTRLTRRLFSNWIVNLKGVKTVLDVGCGDTAFAAPLFGELGINYTGMALGLDVPAFKKRGIKVFNGDFSFLEDFDDGTFDMIFARHVIEHSPAPILTLLEWYRVSNQFLCMIVPNPEFHGKTGPNHYYVLDYDQWKHLLNRAGWSLIWDKIPMPEIDPEEKGKEEKPFEFWYMCEKKRNL